MSKPTTISEYNKSLIGEDKKICELLYTTINKNLPQAESKIWHAHPVWFLDGNPIVGYSKLKESVRLMFWSGIDFDEKDLEAGTGKFKDASIQYRSKHQIMIKDLERWLKKSRNIQWDYKNIVKRKGYLEKIK